MARIYTPIHIPLPIETVFNYVTTPGNWPQWHPSSLGVSGATDHSLEIGEQVTEEFLVAGRRGETTWTVVERVFPQKWAIKATIAGGIVTYSLRSQEDGTFFEREFVYNMGNPLLVLLDWLILRRRVEAESRKAVQQLKSILLQQHKEVTRETT